MSDIDEKVTSPFDEESEDETIALSKDELDDILSEAEIVQETSGQKKEAEAAGSVEENIEIEEGLEEIETEEMPAVPEAEEFDISGEIDELTPEDLESIEIEEEELDSYSAELESEMGEDVELPDDLKLDLEEEEPEAATGAEIELDTEIDEEVDLDTYIDSLQDEIEIGGEEEDLLEPPVLGEGEESAAEGEDMDQAFKEAGIETAEEETVSLDELDLENIEEITLEEEQTASLEEEAPVTEEAVEDLGAILEEETPAEEPGTGIMLEEEEAAAEEPIIADEAIFETAEEGGGIELSEEEEKILNEDFDIEAEAATEAEAAAEPVEEIAATGEASAPDAALMNDITTILKYMDTLLGDLPEEKIREFSQSEFFPVYKDVFEKLKLT